MRGRPPVVAAVASALSLCLLVVACSGGGTKRRFIPAPPGTVAKVTTAPPASDYSDVALAPADGRVTMPKVEITGGDSIMSGLIAGPDGPVAGATVRLERFVGDAVAHLDVISNADGTWRAPQLGAPTTVPTVPANPTPLGQVTTVPAPPSFAPPTPVAGAVGSQGILGGRYRVRAWRSPDLALTTPQILFLEGKQNRQLGLQLSRYTGITASSVSSPDPPTLDTFTTVTAIVTTVSVDGDGVVRSVPLAGATVSLAVGPGWLFVGGPTFTNGAGRAAFQLRCQALGQSPVELTVNGGQVFDLPVRACGLAPTTTSSLPLDPFGTGASSSSIPGRASSSTTRAGTPTT